MYRLLVTCSDQPGIVAAISNFLFTHGANIVALDQHSTDPVGGTFFLRLEFQLPHETELPLSVLRRSFQRAVADKFALEWKLSDGSQKKRVALMVSRQDHALMEILWRWKRGELPAELTMVISNHDVAREAVESFGIPYHHVVVEKAAKDAAEERILGLLDGQVDLIVLARYMQILTPRFVNAYREKIINIHHSFLPAFVGARPYQQAAERGVKLIGATAHYVTEDLDEGPIIEQDVLRVTHRQNVQDLKELGASIERQVLARALRWHLEDRIIVDGNKTVVFA